MRQQLGITLVFVFALGIFTGHYVDEWISKDVYKAVECSVKSTILDIENKEVTKQKVTGKDDIATDKGFEKDIFPADLGQNCSSTGVISPGSAASGGGNSCEN